MRRDDIFDVVVLGFEPRAEPPEARLQRSFGLDHAQAAQLIGELPKAVQRGLSRVRAEYYRRALVLCGAQVEVHDRSGRAVPMPEAGTAEKAPEPEIHAPNLAESAAAGNAQTTLREVLDPMFHKGVGRGAAQNTVPIPVHAPVIAAAQVAPRELDLVAPRASSERALELERTSEGNPLAPRVPSSIWDPALVAASAPQAKPNSAPHPPIAPIAPQFDLAKSVIAQGLWRPSPAASKPAPPLPAYAPIPALTLDPDEEEELRMMPAWDVPEPASMAEPSRRPVAGRANSSRRPPDDHALRSDRSPEARREPRVQPTRPHGREPLRTPGRSPPDASRSKRSAAPRSLWAELATRASAWLRRLR